MKVLPFTIPVPHDHTIIVQEEVLPYFYTHLHRHEEIQLTWILEGEGTLITGNSIHVFRPGEIYLLGPDLPHLFKSESAHFEQGSTKSVHTITIFFNPYRQLGSLFELPEMKSIRAFLKQFQSGFKVPEAMLDVVSANMLNIKKAEGVDQLMQFLQLLKILSSMKNLEPLTATTYPQGLTDSEGMRIGAIYNYIIQNHDRALSLEEVSDQAHMTPQAFCRYFKKHTNHTFISFLNKIRINEACKMLVNQPENGISAVAYACGFSSITNFNRVFKTVTGRSPSGYIGRMASKA
ncbi:AraC family transcriptional regulator [Mucilaginibacter daejeonensis]|uniref:AraC family transcriptional regulator n=1 Tax=Mucilaginibacter daejeonensis TaxID=398049 RepID=UPI001D177E44|nr:AraC family transcriptional regulator [Mucilaginibacter daejeonensis]UEG52580.1 AraC family transcriptional regulator [Mucilaginibacter daejeonensis]